MPLEAHQASVSKCFIYYRVSHADEACRAVQQAQGQLRASLPSVQMACYVRRDAQGPTVLETYTQSGAFDDDTRALIAALVEPAVAPWIQGGRRAELFTSPTA